MSPEQLLTASMTRDVVRIFLCGDVMTVYHNRLILYGCGDFLNDYEDITGG
jgi:poly-gamma-glutamate capsule biosynthesis protein CapA/YwtB (metallophosphatase superfamily)